jgi:hypothetical protein
MSCLKENATRFHYKDQIIDFCGKLSPFFLRNNTKHIHLFCIRVIEFQVVKQRPVVSTVRLWWTAWRWDRFLWLLRFSPTSIISPWLSMLMYQLGDVAGCNRDIVSLVRLQVLTTASMKVTAFWGIAPCSLVEVDRSFRGAYCLHHHRPVVGASMHLWNVGLLQRCYTALYHSLTPSTWKISSVLERIDEKIINLISNLDQPDDYFLIKTNISGHAHIGYYIF